MGSDITTAANPLTYVKALISPSQTLTLHNALNAAGAHSTRYVLDGAGHRDLSLLGDFESGLPWSTKQTMDIIVDFLKRSIGDTGR
jgi:hypothetical protein